MKPPWSQAAPIAAAQHRAPHCRHGHPPQRRTLSHPARGFRRGIARTTRPRPASGRGGGEWRDRSARTPCRAPAARRRSGRNRAGARRRLSRTKKNPGLHRGKRTPRLPGENCLSVSLAVVRRLDRDDCRRPITARDQRYRRYRSDVGTGRLRIAPGKNPQVKRTVRFARQATRRSPATRAWPGSVALRPRLAPGVRFGWRANRNARSGRALAFGGSPGATDPLNGANAGFPANRTTAGRPKAGRMSAGNMMR